MEKRRPMTPATESTPLARPPKKQRLRDKRPERYQELLRVATRVLATEGYAAMNVNRIAEEAGVGVGTLYNYFDDKDDLFLACVEAAAAIDLQLKQERIDLEQPVVEVLRTIFRVDQELTVADPDGQRLLRSVFYGINSHLPVGKVAQQMYSGSIELVEQVLEKGIDQGIFELEAHELRLAALLINGLMETFYVLSPFLGEQAEGAPHATERAFDLLCRGILKKRGRQKK
jgi:AcrR family transcriptional regulator